MAKSYLQDDCWATGQSTLRASLSRLHLPQSVSVTAQLAASKPCVPSSVSATVSITSHVSEAANLLSEKYIQDISTPTFAFMRWQLSGSNVSAQRSVHSIKTGLTSCAQEDSRHANSLVASWALSISINLAYRYDLLLRGSKTCLLEVTQESPPPASRGSRTLESGCHH